MYCTLISVKLLPIAEMICLLNLVFKYLVHSLYQ